MINRPYKRLTSISKILQGVTLGGTGKDVGDRHPKIGKDCLIGAHSTILGNIKVGKGAMIAAGSLVLKPVAAHTTVAGAPAREVGKTLTQAPALDMKQMLGQSRKISEDHGKEDEPAQVEKFTVRRGGGTTSLADQLPEGDGSWYI